MTTKFKGKLMKDVAWKFLRGRAQVLSDLSLQRPLTSNEAERFRVIMAELQKEQPDMFVKVGGNS